MNSIGNYISESLNGRIAGDSLRVLKTEDHLTDFCSNDYLGFSRSDELRDIFESALQKHPAYRLGSTGSRLLAGNAQFTEDLESEIATFHNSEAALLFNSGYDANVGIFSSLPQRGDTIICDEYIHASIIDGARLSHATRYVFKHNDLESLERKLRHAQGRIYIAVESVYSMNGDESPLAQICALAERFDAALIVDEAHAVGVFGNQGRGLVDELDLNSRVFARTVTFGKALGVHGAAVLGSDTLRSYLINYARSFIYTTAPSFLSNLSIKCAYDFLQLNDDQSPLRDRIEHFQSLLHSVHQLDNNSRSPIQILHIAGNSEARKAATTLQNAGFDVRAILSPTVPEGKERLRICLHNHNSMEDITSLCNSIKKYCEA